VGPVRELGPDTELTFSQKSVTSRSTVPSVERPSITGLCCDLRPEVRSVPDCRIWAAGGAGYRAATRVICVGRLAQAGWRTVPGHPDEDGP
jgi:hypothetical protein